MEIKEANIPAKKETLKRKRIRDAKKENRGETINTIKEETHLIKFKIEKKIIRKKDRNLR